MRTLLCDIGCVNWSHNIHSTSTHFNYKSICTLKPINLNIETYQFVHWNLSICTLKPINLNIETYQFVHWNLSICTLKPINLNIETYQFEHWNLSIWTLLNEDSHSKPFVWTHHDSSALPNTLLHYSIEILYSEE